MILEYLVLPKKHVSFPGVVYQAPILDDDTYLFERIQKNEVNKLAIIYNDNAQNIFQFGLYVQVLGAEINSDGTKVINFIGLKRLINQAFVRDVSDEELDKIEIEQKTALLESGLTVDDTIRVQVIFDESAPNGDEDFWFNFANPEAINLLQNTLKSFENVGEDYFEKNLMTGKSWKFDEIFDFQAKFGFTKKNLIERKMILNVMLSFLKDIENEFSKIGYFESVNSEPKNMMLTNLARYFTKSLEIESEIQDEINKSLSEHQKEYMLREKMKVIKEKLDDIDGTDEDEYEKIIKGKKTNQMFPESVKKLIRSETKRLSQMMPASPDANLTKTYIENLKALPWRKTEIDFLDIKKVREVLDKYHYGLDEVKERIVEYLAVIINNRKHNPVDESSLIKIDKDYEIDLNLFKEEKESRSKKKQKALFNNVPILTLVGPPGTGKTSLSNAIAEALNKKFIKISLGGVHDESEIRGHRRTYVGAMPGKIIKGILKAQISNPLILLDEIDKMASDMKGDPASAMLEVLDPEQNSKFQDHYLEHEYDLSKVMFIATANYFEDIPAPLLDRVEIIELSPYTLNEKVKIARDHLLPKVIQQTSLTPKLLQISDETLKFIIKHYTLEAGVRGLKRVLDKLARKIFVKIIDDPKLKSFEVTIDKLDSMLGVIKFKEEEKDDVNAPGVVNGIAYTAAGGSSLEIEVTTYPGKGEIKLTGQLKDVMQESAQIALTYVRANSEKFGVSDFDFENNTIHIHVPEGAVPKDGPSAGVTFTTAIISALSKRSVPSNIGMTGEITLRGKVFEIGGLKEKSFAATQKKLKYIFIPESNVKNLRDIPNEIKSELIYIPVKEYDQIYDVIFNKQKPKYQIETKLDENN
ncbi:endopeptidase La [Mycoplasmopsis pullorum]|uniref:endopeptidase La n=1 Tax=Mycoplasmopsis pullorum TaxID=48003 RepID=UPI001118D8CA|nr:endopeptidase La [Mycoplasmopsis pullorum]TNK85678.1 endopeptidase La [Mycoplasmopsis pullorum]